MGGCADILWLRVGMCDEKRWIGDVASIELPCPRGTMDKVGFDLVEQAGSD
jgi:hypothetical protein